jgi:hypothetical protein
VTTPFNNPLTGAQGSLVRAQIKSPNFSLAGQTGWAILKNGDAYFFNIVAEGTITATSFIGTDFVINSAGAFFYNGTPAAGNLFCSIASAAGTDAHGNAYGAGMNIGSQTGPHLQVDLFGNLTVYNAAGDNVGQWIVGDGSMRFYGSTGPAAGNLKVAISPVAGTDAEGNVYGIGLTVYGNNGSPVGMNMPTGNPHEATSGAIESGVLSPGVAGTERQYVQAVSPVMTGAAEADVVLVALFSSANTVAGSAQGNLTYISAASVETNCLTWDALGLFAGVPFVLDNQSLPSSISSGPALYGGSGHEKYVGTDGSAYNTGRATIYVTSPQTINTTTSSNAITALSGINVGAIKYRIHAKLFCSNSPTAAAQAAGINASTNTAAISTSLTNVAATFLNATAGTFNGVSLITTSGRAGSTGTIAASAVFIIDLDGEITFTSAGLFGLSASCVTAAGDTFTINPGSFLELMPCT